jgi:large subunit ribosomal protein L30
LATIKLTQTRSPIRRTPDQRRTLIGLGVNEMPRTVELTDTPAVRGMIRKMQPIVSVES